MPAVLAPGSDVTWVDLVPTTGQPTDTGAAFVVGLADRGPVTPTTVRTLDEFTALFGPPVAYGLLSTAVEMILGIPGAASPVTVGRVVGPAASPSTLTLSDRAATPVPTLRVDAAWPGVSGQALSVQVLDGTTAGTFVLAVTDGGRSVERSPDLASPTAAVAWAATSQYIRVVDLASATAPPNNNPAVRAASALTGGTDDRNAITDASWQAALDRFGRELGPGQVLAPGRTTAAAHLQLHNHARTNQRFALLDAPNSGDVPTLTNVPNGIRTSGTDPLFSFACASWLTIKGLTADTTRVVPSSPAVAGLMAAGDASGGPGQPNGGVRGVVPYALAVQNGPFNETDRATLNNAGANIFRTRFGTTQLYGYRTADTGRWRNASDVRFRLLLDAEARRAGDSYVLSRSLTRQTISEFTAQVAGILTDHYANGELDTNVPAGQAFIVDGGPTVNTPATMAAGRLLARIGFKRPGMAERVEWIVTMLRPGENI